ncbi:methionyl-tRNA formyltransferase [Terriglobus roseus DSM 18391]|uniref:Methionyl-tRNA formyltransferase n=1 Tax=Terriglobus roseus (strain DSM 18391 / NRRL B-41598 / KBS 63) TaxID=926566 RepID=I3ZCX6_TERRK|nr:methionyl-tRNA formyltransferase [Terriglobus roseus]AFL87094.1 methionyl-tRNA formyltransferase [Terriglobus roseus DSM 18391]
MRLVFCGTPQFAVPTLEALLAAGHQVSLVISQPDKPVGRNGEIHPTPVKRAALAHDIAVTQPEKLKHNESLRETLTQIAPDAIIVVAYGRIIPQWMLDLPRFGCINGHGSLLPRWRGAAPIQWAIASGDTETGVTTMRLNAGLDTGPMLMKWAVTITPQTTSPQLFETLSTIGADLMVQTLAGLEAGLITPKEQDDAQHTLAPILTRDDARILFTRTATEIDQRFRGFQPWPGTFTTLRGKKLIVHAMHVADVTSNEVPGTLILQEGAMFAVCAGGTAIALDEVQMEGKKCMPAEEFLRGFQIKSGETLGEATTQ